MKSELEVVRRTARRWWSRAGKSPRSQTSAIVHSQPQFLRSSPISATRLFPHFPPLVDSESDSQSLAATNFHITPRPKAKTHRNPHRTTTCEIYPTLQFPQTWSSLLAADVHDDQKNANHLQSTIRVVEESPRSPCVNREMMYANTNMLRASFRLPKGSEAETPTLAHV